MESNALFIQALGPLAVFYTDPDISEIMIDGPDRVVVEYNNRGLAATQLKFDSADGILQIIHDLLAIEDRSISPGEIHLTASLPQRMGYWVAILPPAAQNGPYLVFCKHTRQQISWEQLLAFNAISAEGLAFLKEAVHERANLLVAGGANSGKTTILNRIAELIPANERVIAVEEHQELRLQHPGAIFLEAGQASGLTFSQTMQISATMRPDWLVFGEIRGSGAMTTLEIFSNGHAGMTTIHGDSTENALQRLEIFGTKENPGLGRAEIRSLVNTAFRLVIFQKYLRDGRRRIIEIVELCGVENELYQLKRLFRYNPETDRLEPTGEMPSWRSA